MKRILFLFLFLSTSLLAAERRLVAIGDIHGDFEAFSALLQHVGLIDDHHQWIGGDTVLVQTGDILDRGKGVREAMDLLMSMEKQAPQQGGRIVVLIGNHEAMNIVGLTKDVHRDVYAQFTDKQSRKRQKTAYRSQIHHNRTRASSLGKTWKIHPNFREEWFASHPMGLMEYMDAMGPKGVYGSWLREKDTVTLIDGTLFMHAGISPELAKQPIDEINRTVHEDIERSDRWRDYLIENHVILPFFTGAGAINAARDWVKMEEEHIADGARIGDREKRLLQKLPEFIDFSFGSLIASNGPLWFRGFARWSEEEGQSHVDELLTFHKADRIVCGHTPQKKGITKRFHDRLFLIDTGMLSSVYKGGKASALEFHQGRCTAFYLDSSVALCRNITQRPALSKTPIGPPLFTLPEDKPELYTRSLQSRDGKLLPLQKDEDILAFLRDAKITKAKEFGKGITRPLRAVLVKDGIEMRAIIRNVDVTKRGFQKQKGNKLRRGFHDRAIHELAAYELSRLFELNRVPPVVKRRYGKGMSTIQIWVENATTETSRMEKGIKVPNILLNDRQRRLMKVFDALIFNFDRNTGNILYGPDWYLWFIDHTRSFREEKFLPEKGEDIIICERHFWEKLKTVSDEQITEKLSPHISTTQIKAVLARRTLLVTHIQGMIDQRTEAAVIYDL